MKSPQFELFHEDIYSALKTCVDAMGGPKKVAVELWGNAQTPAKLGEKLSNCLNSHHAQKLAPEEILFILRGGRQVGCHAGINFICRDVGYADPNPLEPEEETIALQRQIIANQEVQIALYRKMEAARSRMVATSALRSGAA
jgi:hypothetical protein